MNPISANKSAYVALVCLIAFVIVITICVIKQFIWDPLLAKSFQTTIRPVISESVRRISSNFYRPQSNEVSRFSLLRSISDACLTSNDPQYNVNPITLTHSLPISNEQSNPLNKSLPPPRSYGSSSSHAYAYTNYASDALTDEYPGVPLLQFHCEYDPSNSYVKLTIANLRHMNIFRSAIKPNTYVRIRCLLSPTKSNQIYETTAQPFDDWIVYNQTFLLLSDIHSGDRLDYEIKFFIVLFIEGLTYEIAEGIHSMQDDCLTYVSFMERTIAMNLKFIETGYK